MPSPSPPGHALGWAPGFVAASDAAMARAWSISGPLIDGLNCSVAVLDCGDVNSTQSIFPNPAQPFKYPAVKCNASISTAPMLVFSGSRCALIDSGNSLRCYWDNRNQSFMGTGCATSAAPTQCACRHLTDFAGAQAPSIPMCSLSELTSFSFGDIVSKLKLLFEARQPCRTR